MGVRHRRAPRREQAARFLAHSLGSARGPGVGEDLASPEAVPLSPCRRRTSARRAPTRDSPPVPMWLASPSCDVHHPPDRKSRARPTVVKGVWTQRRRRRVEGGPAWIARAACSGAVVGRGRYGSGSWSAWRSSPGSSSSSRTPAVARAASTEERSAGSCRQWDLNPRGRCRTVTSVFSRGSRSAPACRRES